jgi:hypothetical protein
MLGNYLVWLIRTIGSRTMIIVKNMTIHKNKGLKKGVSLIFKQRTTQYYVIQK